MRSTPSSFLGAWTMIGLAALLTPAAPLHAQDLRALMTSRLRGQTAITFTAPAREVAGPLAEVSNAVFKPAGPGPFPAVVLVHT